jgi:hypothetical protein
MNWIDDIGQYLEDNGIGTVGTDIFCSGFDEIMENCIALFNHGGDPPFETASGDCTIWYPELGVRVRDVEDATAYDNMKSILKLLNGICNTVMGSIAVISIEAINSDPVFLGQDDNDRFVYSSNFSLMIEED